MIYWGWIRSTDVYYDLLNFKLFPTSKIDFWPFLKLQKMEFSPKKIPEIDLFDIMSFFGLDFLKFSDSQWSQYLQKLCFHEKKKLNCHFFKFHYFSIFSPLFNTNSIIVAHWWITRRYTGWPITNWRIPRMLRMNIFMYRPMVVPPPVYQTHMGHPVLRIPL